jgi:hypothetical protein
MEIFRHVFAFVFIIVLLLLIKNVINKQVMHFKLLKELYPNKLSQINSYFNPLAFIYIFGLNISIIIWFSIPIYYKKKDIIINNIDEINIEKTLIANNKKIFIFFVVLVFWFLIGILFFH